MENKLLLYFLFATGFLGLSIIANSLYAWGVISVLIFFSVKEIGKTNCFRLCIIGMLVSIALCAISSQHYRGQTIMQSLSMSRSLMEITYFYFLLWLNPSVESVEKFIEKALKIVLLCYFIQVLIFPVAIFNGASADWIQNNSTPYRFIYVNGFTIITLGIFYNLNKYLNSKQSKYLVLFIICISVLFIRGFRIMLFACLVSVIVLYYRFQKDKNIISLSIKLIGIFILLAITFFILYLSVPAIQTSLASIMERSSGGANFNNEDYIRMLNLRYFTELHFTDSIEYFWGSGIPHDSSKYGAYMNSLKSDTGYNYVDWGLLGLSWVGGMPLVFFILFYMVKCIITKTSKQQLYISSWFIFLIIVSITDPESYSRSAMLVQSHLLYLIYKIQYDKIQHYRCSIQH